MQAGLEEMAKALLEMKCKPAELVLMHITHLT
jgi:hypothetical protein